MQIFFPSQHHLHHPQKDYSDGFPPFEHLEIPERIDNILKGIQVASSVDLVKVNWLAQEAVYNLHDKDYVDFLLAISETVKPEQEYIPVVFRDNLSKAPLFFRGGMYCQEVGTPINADSIKAALNSAAVAEEAAKYLRENGQNAFALCRPPGHHAGRHRYGGYCFFNNAYIAARILAQQGSCAVLDIDYHLGDGSLEFADSDIPYFSLHADPWKNYPYLDANRILPTKYSELMIFPPEIKGHSYLNLLEHLTTKLVKENFNYIVVSLGFDTLGTDYIQDEYIYLEPRDYTFIAQVLTKMTAKKLIVLEGGYDLPNLSDCAKYFISGLINPNSCAKSVALINSG